MAKIHGGRAIARALKAEGVDTVFTLTGGHIVAIIDGCVSEGIAVIDVRHEQAAVHAADAYARITGRLGVAVVTAGPGVTNAVTGVANAWYANSPVLVLGGHHLTQEDLRGGLQEMDHPRLFRSITKWAHTAPDAKRLPEYIATAARHAFSGRGGPVFLDVAWDVLGDMVEETAIRWPTGYRADRPAGIDDTTLARIAEALAAAERPVVFGGTGLRWSRQPGYTDALDGFVTALRAPVYLNSLARGSLRFDHPLLGNRARSAALGGADLVVALGVDWDFRTGFGNKVASGATVIHLDAEPVRVGWNRAADIGVVADPGTVAAQLLDAAGTFSPTQDRDWTDQMAAAESELQAKADEAGAADGSPVPPERFAREVAEFFGDDTIIAADGGDIVSTTAKWLQTSRPGGLLDPGPFGCLGVGAPFALAAKAVEPDTRVGIVYGDGSFAFNAMEYDTLIRHQLPVVGVVGNDGAWNNIRTIHRMLYPDTVTASDLGIRPYERMVEGLGGYGEFVDKASELRPALERAEQSGVPALVNVHIADQLRMSSAYGS
ncbi:MAG: thiamine pyrophosphate-binding protein [Acidimicrobiia bacterium]|nr:MAG: thiamine pyrophosphate-binding protein [Acidimicrobiia bacterium]